MWVNGKQGIDVDVMFTGNRKLNGNQYGLRPLCGSSGNGAVIFSEYE